MLRDLVPFVQFKKREKHPWRVLRLVKVQAFPRIRTGYQEILLISLYSVWIREKACNFTKSNIPPWVYFTFFELLPNGATHHVSIFIKCLSQKDLFWKTESFYRTYILSPYWRRIIQVGFRYCNILSFSFIKCVIFNVKRFAPFHIVTAVLLS